MDQPGPVLNAYTFLMSLTPFNDRLDVQKYFLVCV